MKSDVAELEKLQEQASRTRVKDILSLEIRKLQTEIVKKMETTGASADVKQTPIVTMAKPKTRFIKDLDTYGK